MYSSLFSLSTGISSPPSFNSCIVSWEREGGRREGGRRKGGREGGKEEGREGGRREEGREGGREGEREKLNISKRVHVIS